MSISVDSINLRFNVKPDYDQQQLQQLQKDLKQGQEELLSRQKHANIRHKRNPNY